VASILRITRAGVAASIAVGLLGWGVERARFGATDEDALARVQIEIRDRLDAAADTVSSIAARLTVAPDRLRAALRDPQVTRALFDEASAALAGEPEGRAGVTLYGGDGAPIAWAGRVFDLPKERLSGPAAWFVAAGAIGPRLIHVQPVGERPASPRGSAPRGGAVVAEYSLPTDANAAGPPDTFVLPTSIVPVKLRPGVAGRPAPSRPYTFLVSSRSGSISAEADVSQVDLALARARWRDGVWASVIGALAITLLLWAGPLLELRRTATEPRSFLILTFMLATTCVAALVLLLFATRRVASYSPAGSPWDLLLVALAALALAAIFFDLVERRRVAHPRPRLTLVRQSGRIGLRHVFAGAAAAGVLTVYELGLRRIVTNTTLDVLHFSLHPLEAQRLAVAFGLVLLHAAAMWTAVAVTRAASTFVRAPRSSAARSWAVTGWIIGTALIVGFLATEWNVPVVPLATAVGVAGACAAMIGSVERRLRRASQAARLFTFFLALLVPALATYPSLVAYAVDAKQSLVADVYGPQVLSQREDLQRRLQQTIDQIDAIPSLADYLGGAEGTAAADRAFVIWSRTDLAGYRLTSAVELYGADGGLVSRFALHLPEYEYSAARSRAASCTWETLFDEVSPFGSSERHVLRTSRAICERGRVLGNVVVRVMLDYRTLPFISIQSPYLEALETETLPRSETVLGRDIEFAMYGWSRAPIIESRTTVWTLPDRVFARLTSTREPFWDTLERDATDFRVYFMSDRGEIYALGYPVISWQGHIINLAELTLLVMVLYAALIVAATVLAPLTARARASARALLREVRSSFYRKLFLAFVAGAVVPVLILAVAIRTYFANELTAGGVEAAQRTVTTAQRLVEDYAAIQQSGSTSLAVLDDQIMVLVWRAIDEDVNLFDRGRLQATSARDLFASLLLSTRTPGDVYKTILLDRAPTFVGDEQIGDHEYRLAAAPVRAGGREGIVTVPLTNRRAEIEQQIDELDRRVRSAAVLFIVLGAAIGYWMAERIADPVNRLTRATRRIARGELDARIAATSSDELRRLVEDFNQMAADLQRQRTELERTQRLEAWADMARQVAHDIKNPLTPIQLSAEHARRVNIDRGRPLSPVLDDCVNAILGQVRLLRQISAEFSSFASSPTPRPEATDAAALIEEVVGPYRLGLGDRIALESRNGTSGTMVYVDRTLFSRTLTNVIENALHAMPGQGRLTITTSVSPQNPGWMMVEIADTGVGMDQEALERIFEPYFSTKATGTGLGLTIAKRNVELNGGTIEVRSQKGAGTTVVLQIPLAH
jgi:signal transduction histidine kinase